VLKVLSLALCLTLGNINQYTIANIKPIKKLIQNSL